MPETDNIARMATKVSDEIFSTFYWKKTGPVNQNWKCVSEDHSGSTHPSDVVFKYRDPFSSAYIYINVDLKSYAKVSISKAAIGGALKNLSESTECAQISQGWQDLYLSRDETCKVRGLLFLYNHDCLYDDDFLKTFALIDPANYSLRASNRMYLIDPKNVIYLSSVCFDIKYLRGNEKLPKQEDCSFFYPDAIRRKPIRRWGNPATLEMITGPFITLKYRLPINGTESGFIIYYKGPGSSVDEFKYLIDYLFHYQIIQNSSLIRIRMPNATNNSAAFYSQSLDEYISNRNADKGVRKRLDILCMETVRRQVDVFSPVELGMRND